MNKKELVIKNIQNCSAILEDTYNYCLDKVDYKLITEDFSRMLGNISAVMTATTLILKDYDLLNPRVLSMPSSDFYELVGYQVIWLTKSLFFWNMSSIEHNMHMHIAKTQNDNLKQCIKKIRLLDIFKEIFDVEDLNRTFDNDKKEKLDFFLKILKNEPPVKTFRDIINKSHKNSFLTGTEFTELIFLVDIRNAITHNNGIPKAGISGTIYGSNYVYKALEDISGKFEACLIFNKRLIEINFAWLSNIYNNKLN